MSIDPILFFGRSFPRYQKTSHTSSGDASTSIENECSCMGGRVPSRPMAGEMDVADSVLDLIGGTPLVRLSRIGRGLTCDLIAKMETTNPGGSVKDRPAVAMVDAAERDGLLKPAGPSSSPRPATPASGWPSSPPSAATPACSGRASP